MQTENGDLNVKKRHIALNRIILFQKESEWSKLKAVVGTEKPIEIALYGASVLGQYVYQQLCANKCSKYHVKVWIDNCWHEDTLCEIPVVNEETFLKSYAVDAVVMCIRDKKIAQERFLSLKRKHLTEVFFVPNTVWDFRLPILNDVGTFHTYVKKWDSVMPVLPYLEFQVADACNLKCKACTHFSNLVDRDRYPSITEYENSMKMLAEKFFSIEKFRLMGGEPLLNQELPKYIRIARKYFPLSDIRVVTNGLLVTSISDELMDAMRENTVSFDISRYQPTSKKLPEIIEFLDRNRIKYHILKPVETFWAVLCKGERDYREAFHKCPDGPDGSYCKFLRNGRLYPCPDLPMRYETKEYLGLDISEEEFLENGIELSGKDGWELLSRLHEPFTLCRYCAESRRTIPWSAGKPSPEDWMA